MIQIVEMIDFLLGNVCKNIVKTANQLEENQNQYQNLLMFLFLRVAYLIGSSKYDAYFIQLVCFGSTRKQWSVCVDFGSNASYRPKINGAAIYRGMQEYLRSSVPSGRDVIRVRRTRTYLAYQTKIGYFY